MSKLLQFVSRPVILGYFAGITVAIVVTQLFILPVFARQGPIADRLKGWIFFPILPNCMADALVGFVSLGVLLIFRKTLKKWPDALIMLIVAVLLTDALNLWLGELRYCDLGDYELVQEPVPELTLPLIDFASSQ